MDDGILFEKATHFHSVFSTLQQLENLKVTRTRKENLAEKRQEKRTQLPVPISDSNIVWVGPSVPALSTAETNRTASISDPTISSGSGLRFHATQEKESELLGNLFCVTTLKSLFFGIPLSWVNGRSPLPVLQWRHRS